MDKQLFIDSINALKKQSEHDNNCYNAFKVILPHCHVTSYDNSVITEAFISFLKIEMKDTNKDGWIDYFIYELDYGKNYTEGMCKYKDGSIIDISTPEKLFDFLISEKYF